MNCSTAAEVVRDKLPCHGTADGRHVLLAEGEWLPLADGLHVLTQEHATVVL